MAQFVHLAIDHRVFNLLAEPLDIKRISKPVRATLDQSSGHFEFAKGDSRWLNSMVDAHIVDLTVVKLPKVVINNILGKHYHVLVRTACREIAQEDIETVHIVDTWVCIGHRRNHAFAQAFKQATERHHGLLLPPVSAHNVIDSELYRSELYDSPIL